MAYNQADWDVLLKGYSQAAKNDAAYDKEEEKRRKQAQKDLRPLSNSDGSITIGDMGTYTANGDGTYTSKDGQTRTAEQVKKLAGIESNYQAEQKKIKDDNNIFKVIGEETAKATDTVAKGIVSGVQQGAGAVADVAIQGGGVIDEVANQIRGGTEEEKNKRRIKNIENSEQLRKLLHGTKDLSGNSIQGTSYADEAAGKIASGKGDVKDYATVAAAGLDAATGATQFANPTALLRGAAANTGKTGLSLAKGVVTNSTKGLAAKDAAKLIGKQSAAFASADALEGGAREFGESGDLGRAAGAAIKQGTQSFATQAIMGGAGYGAGRLYRSFRDGKAGVKSDAKTDTKTPDGEANQQKQLGAGYKDDAYYDSEIQRYQRNEFDDNDDVWKDRVIQIDDGQTVNLNDIEAKISQNNSAIRDLTQQATGDMPNGTQLPDGADPSTYTGDVTARAKAAEKVDALTQENAQLQAQLDSAATFTGGASKQLDPEKIANNFKALQAEAADAKNYNFEVAKNKYMDESGLSPEAAKKQLEDFENGNYSDDMYRTADRPTDIGQVFGNKNMPDDISQAAFEVMSDLSEAYGIMDNLMTSKKYAEVTKGFDDAYRDKMDDISKMPEPRQELEIAELNDKYMKDIADAEEALQTNAPEVERYQQIIDHLELKREIFSASSYTRKPAVDR